MSNRARACTHCSKIIAACATYYYHFDGLGSLVALTNADGNTVQTYGYSVYGRVGALDASHPNRLMFTGREFDKETGLYYYRARYYKPEIGRFLQVDPVRYAGGMNLYRYCRNNPWNSIDPFGKTEVSESASIEWVETVTFDVSPGDSPLPNGAGEVTRTLTLWAWVQIKGTTHDGVTLGVPPNVHVTSTSGTVWPWVFDPCVSAPSYWTKSVGDGNNVRTIQCAETRATFTWSNSISFSLGWGQWGGWIQGPIIYTYTKYVQSTVRLWICADGSHGQQVHHEDPNSTFGSSGGSNWTPYPAGG